MAIIATACFVGFKCAAYGWVSPVPEDNSTRQWIENFEANLHKEVGKEMVFVNRTDIDVNVIYVARSSSYDGGSNLLKGTLRPNASQGIKIPAQQFDSYVTYDIKIEDKVFRNVTINVSLNNAILFCYENGEYVLKPIYVEKTNNPTYNW